MIRSHYCQLVCRCGGLALLVLSASPTHMSGQDKLFVKYINNLNEGVALWFQPQNASTYLRPPLVLAPKSETQAQLHPQ